MLSPGEASRLAGALGFASQYVFRRLGRAMLVPIFRQKSMSCYDKAPPAKALRWWLVTLDKDLCEVPV